MVNVFVAVFPAASMAVQVTVVAPRANVAPDRRSHVAAVAPETLSVAVGAVKVTGAPLRETAVTLSESETVRAGAVVSRTVTVKVSRPVLPALSVAVQVMVVVPRANVLPESRSQVARRRPSTSSRAATPVQVT